MFTTLDTQPQEWMEGNEHNSHTIAACHFQNLDHLEYWVDKLVPKNRNGSFVKWSSGRHKSKTRERFIENCLNCFNEIDFQVNCVSTNEGQMSWFAWSFYMQIKNSVTQQLDCKNRNCLVFQIGKNQTISFPVLRAGYLIWYYFVLKYLFEFKNISGKIISDNFCGDEVGPGEGKALGVSFVNFLLGQSNFTSLVSLPKTSRYRACDRLSDFFCGWVNTFRSIGGHKQYESKFNKLEGLTNKSIESIVYQMDMKITNENGEDITEMVKNAVVQGSA
jgi:hypothetical protein